MTVEFTVLGIPCLGLNGGPAFKHNEAFSFQVATADQTETDRYWNAIVGNGGEESAYRLVQGQMGIVLADHADRSDQSGKPILIPLWCAPNAKRQTFAVLARRYSRKTYNRNRSDGAVKTSLTLLKPASWPSSDHREVPGCQMHERVP